MDALHTSFLQVERHPPAHPGLRIAVVTETYPPEVNGVAITLAQLIRALQACGHEVQLVRPRQGSDDAADREPRFHEVLMRGLPVPRYPNLRMGVPCKRALVRLWSTQRPDVVHIATEGPLGWSALEAARHLKLPVSSDFRTNFHAYSAHYGIGWLRRPILGYLRKFHNATQCTMVPTEALRAELQHLGLKRLAVVARGVDTDRFGPQHRSGALRQHWGAAAHDLVVLYVGRLAAEKNLGVLATAFEAVQKQQPRARLVVVGDGPAREALRGACPDGHFAGQRQGVDLAQHYASADLLLFPSGTETFGNVTTEAMASALPVVAFDHAAAGQLIRDGCNGALAPLGDETTFVRAAVALGADASARRAMGQLARATVMPLGWHAVALRVEQLLRDVIQQGTAPTPSVIALGEPATV